jgi:hypothetical protein
MRFLDLAKQALRAESVQSDRSPSDEGVSSHMSLSSQPKAYTLGDGCGLHGVGSADVAARWRQVELTVGATPEDDHNAQWSVVAVCPCCCGPSRIEKLLCTRCEGADLDELRKTPPCADCGEPSITIEDGSWRCESHRNVR